MRCEVDGKVIGANLANEIPVHALNTRQPIIEIIESQTQYMNEDTCLILRKNKIVTLCERGVLAYYNGITERTTPAEIVGTRE